MGRVGLREDDLEERFVRSGGSGGQRVNKVSTCVILRHRPSGIEVRCQQERSQAMNRVLARRLLLARLEAQRREQLHAEAQRLARIRQQRRRRSERVKARLLREKRLVAEKKSLRREVRRDAWE
ncbi:MAG: peptide chain release factor-like protein [Candidatus Omnitrophota bacterium]|nr:peptide chain release factor-like protein [Candidatus Omnitrophota bacterium]